MADGESSVLPPIEGRSRAASRQGSRPTSATAHANGSLPRIRGANHEAARSPDDPDGEQPLDSAVTASIGGDSLGKRAGGDSAVTGGSGEEEQGRQSREGSDEGGSEDGDGVPHREPSAQDKYTGAGEIEDPEAEYWRDHAAAPKNSKNIAKELAKCMQAAVATKKLDIGEMEVNMIPDKVFELDGLRILWAQSNNIEVLPKLVGSLKDLTQLRIFGNKLRWLPEEVGECAQLQVLWVQNNQLIALPNSLGKLAQLKILAVARNPLRSLPAELMRCANLKEIDFEGLDDCLSVPPVDVIKQGMSGVLMYLKEYSRRLGWVSETATLDLSSMGIKTATLPLEVTNMTSVTALNLSKNAMSALSPSINYMKALTDLDVSDCPNLKQLATDMGAMKQLARVGLDNTLLMSPPPEVVSAGAESIVDYLATLHAAKFTKTLHLTDIDVKVCVCVCVGVGVGVGVGVCVHVRPCI